MKALRWCAWASLLLAGCASTSATPGFRDVASTVSHRTGHAVRWNHATPEDKELEQAVRNLLGKPLTADGAVQVGLLRNPRLQATYEELSVAQADVVQAGLLSNPVFSADITTAERDALSPNLIGGVTQSFLDLLLIPAKHSIAASQFDEVRYRVSDEVLSFDAQVRSAFFVVVGAEHGLTLRRAIAGAEKTSLELTRRQRDAGNANELALASERALAQQADLDVVDAEAEVLAARERLTRLMGLWGTEAAWTAIDRLPDLPPSEPPLEHLESRSVADRLDLAALRQQAQTLQYAAHLAKTSRWTGPLDVGLDVARLKNGSVVVGPRASIELPIFDQRQATIARLEAQSRAAEDLLAARAIEVRSEVRDARNRMLSARDRVERLRTELIPTREQVVAYSQQQYDAMLLGVYQLIAAKQAETAAYRASIEALRDYWVARVELERAIGGRLPPVAGPVAGGAKPASAPPPPSPAPDDHAHHHQP
jgi:cobalt-zinc-cadmium efflux system outer membrane protein